MAKKRRINKSTTIELKKVMHTCSICSMSYALQRNLKRHIQLIHTNDKSLQVKSSKFTCSMCGKIFRYLSHLQRHQLSHLQVRDHNCPLCSLSFVQQIHLKRHLAAKHSSINHSKPYICNMCIKQDRSFSTEWELNRHCQSVHRTLIRCNRCTSNVVFETYRAWKNHIEMHNGIRKWKCQQCNMAFVRHSELNSHISSIHDRVGQFQCSTCQRVFNQRTQIDRHLRKEHCIIEKPIICRLCDQSYHLSSALLAHCTIAHATDAASMCKYCFECCTNTITLSEHINRLHFKKLVNTVSTIVNNNTNDGGEIKTSTVDSQLRLIVRIHARRPPSTLDLSSRMPADLIELFPKLQGLQMTPEGGVSTGQSFVLTFPVSIDDDNRVMHNARKYLVSPVEIDYR